MKRLLLKAISITLVLSIILCGCGKKKEENSTLSDNKAVNNDMNKPLVDHDYAASTNIFTVEGQNVTVEDFYVYLFVFFSLSDVDPSTIDAAKKQEIISTVLYQIELETIEYQMSLKTEGLELPADMNTQVEKYTSNFINSVSLVRLEYFGVTEEAVKRYFERQQYVNAFNEFKAKEFAEGYYEDLKKKYEKDEFFSMYYVLFPSIKYSEDGVPVVDDKNEYVKLSEEELAEQYEKACELRSRALKGESLENLASEYKVDYASGSQIGRVGAYSEELNTIINELEDGDISEVTDTEFGYMIVRMDNKNDEKVKESQLFAEAVIQAKQIMPTIQNGWIEQSGIANANINNDELAKLEVQAVCALLHN